MKTLLIVDDSRTAYVVLARMLNQYQLKSVHAQSAKQAIEYLSTYSVDGIFLDQLMPVMDGDETLKLLKSNPQTKSIPTVMYTAKSDQAYARQVIELGALGILPKELDDSTLKDILAKMGLLPEQIKVENELAAQSTADEKLRVWLESFLANEFSPQLNANVRSVTDTLRRDMIHYGKRMLDKIAQTDKQAQMLEQVSAHSDYLEELYRLANKRTSWLAGFTMMMLIAFLALLGWQFSQSTQLNGKVNQYTEQLDQLKHQLKQDAVLKESSVHPSNTGIRQQEAEKQIEQLPLAGIYSNGVKVAKILSFGLNGDYISAVSNKGFVFNIAQDNRIARSNTNRYFMANDCFGEILAEVRAGVVIRIDGTTLIYSDLATSASALKPMSVLSHDNICRSYHGNEINLRSMQLNDDGVTGLTNSSYDVQLLDH